MLLELPSVVPLSTQRNSSVKTTNEKREGKQEKQHGYLKECPLSSLRDTFPFVRLTTHPR